MQSNQPIIEVRNLKNRLGGQWVHKGLNFSINQGEIIAIVGGSGCGKTTLLRSILRLQPPAEGEINVFGTDIWRCSAKEAQQVRHRWGVMFQSGALFSSMCVLENVLFPIEQMANIDQALQTDLAMLKLTLAGLEPEDAAKFPSELSGGMKKRAALARAIALDPELLFLDEPTTGLDPKSAGEFDQLILRLRHNLGLTVIMITHDMDSLWLVPDRVLFLGDGKALALLPMAELVKQDVPAIRDYLSGVRAYEREPLAKEKGKWTQK